MADESAGHKLVAEVLASAKRSLDRWLKAESMMQTDDPAEVLAIWQKLSGITTENAHDLVMAGFPARLTIEAQVGLPMLKQIKAEELDPKDNRFRVFEATTAAECYAVRLAGKSAVVMPGEKLTINESAFNIVTEAQGWTAEWLKQMFPNSNFEYLKFMLNVGGKART